MPHEPRAHLEHDRGAGRRATRWPWRCWSAAGCGPRTTRPCIRAARSAGARSFRVADLMHTGDADAGRAARRRAAARRRRRDDAQAPGHDDRRGRRRAAGRGHHGRRPAAAAPAGRIRSASSRPATSPRRDPKLIGADELAAKALEVMEAFAITSLVIVDEDAAARRASSTCTTSCAPRSSERCHDRVSRVFRPAARVIGWYRNCTSDRQA